MGVPWFKIKHLENEAGLVALTANFALYDDLSDCMMSLAAGLGSRQEVFSIDQSQLCSEQFGSLNTRQVSDGDRKTKMSVDRNWSTAEIQHAD
jgi:nucleotidyltransferase/DNA polymerase involved in DNA repair